MSETPSELRYTESHEWVSPEEGGVVRVGISDHAQAQLGDLVFVELPNEGDELSQGDACAVVESVKAASDVYAPIAGTVVAVNEALADSPELINNDPYQDGWMFSVRLEDPAQLADLMDSEAYAAHIQD